MFVVNLFTEKMKENYLDLPIFSTGEKMRVKVNKILAKINSGFQEITIADSIEFGKCLILDGIMQCAEKDHEMYDREILKMLKKKDKEILILGGGDGYVAEMALKLNPNLKIKLIELDIEVIQGSKKYLNQKVFDNKQVQLFVGDALHYLRISNGEEKNKFDGLICDFTGEPISKYEKKKFEIFYTEIIGLSKKVLKDGGWIAVQAGDSKTAKKYIDAVKTLKDLLEKHFKNVFRSDIFIPSYGEDDAFLFGKK